jgi:hypothetical protein
MIQHLAPIYNVATLVESWKPHASSTALQRVIPILLNSRRTDLAIMVYHYAVGRDYGLDLTWQVRLRLLVAILLDRQYSAGARLFRTVFK